MATCATCGRIDKLRRCEKCKNVSYCSKECQKMDFQEHKKTCSDPLTLLRQMASASTSSSSSIVTKFFDTAEIRMAFLSQLAAKDLLTAQSVCRLWYRTIALEKTLQQRLFLAPGPGPLVIPAYDGDKLAWAIQPRTKSQLHHANTFKGEWGYAHLLHNADGVVQQKYAVDLKGAKIPIILNPFFTKLWPQDPTNMSNSANITVPMHNKNASWRRMQFTSPPMTQLDMSIWYRVPGQGNMSCPSTGRKSKGVTLGDIADLLAAEASKYEELCWMWLTNTAWWARSADAVVVTGPDGGELEDAVIS